MANLAELKAANEDKIARLLLRQGNLAPVRPRAGAKGICPACGRNVAKSIWNGECARCEPQED